VCPAVVIVCGRDILHEQGQAYAARLKASGVDTKLKMYENGTHGFGADESLPEDAKQAQPILREECFQYKKEMMQYLWNRAKENVT
jgi:acetyl esterase/lipase